MSSTTRGRTPAPGASSDPDGGPSPATPGEASAGSTAPADPQRAAQDGGGEPDTATRPEGDPALPAGAGEVPGRGVEDGAEVRAAGGAGRVGLVAVASVGTLVAVVVYHLVQGPADAGLGELVDFVTGQAGSHVRDVFTGSRLPRTAAGLLAGGALGLAGGLLQGATRNPLAEPATTGVSAGAFTAVVASSVLGYHPGGLARPGVAFVGGLLAAALTYVVAAGGRPSPTRIVLAGMIVTLALMSVSGALLMLFEEEASGLFLWGTGTLVQIDYSRVGPAAVVAGLAALATVVLPRRLDLLGLGDETGASLGMRPGRVRALAIGLAVVLAAAAVSTAGPIVFVGLLAPHVVRLAGVVRHRWLLPLGVVWGAVVVLLADAVAQQHVSSVLDTELPVGVFTAMVGAPALVLLARRLPAGGDTMTGRLGRTARAVPFPVVVVLSAAALVAALLLGLMLGDLDLSAGDVVGALSGTASDDFVREIVVDLRLPRLVVAALAGASLAACGALLQGISRNPLADPSVIGVTGGAAVGGLALVVLVDDVPASSVPFAAFGGGLIAVGIVLLAAWRPAGGRGAALGRRSPRLRLHLRRRAAGRADARDLAQGALAPERLLLVGVAVAAFTTALTDLMVVLSPLDVSRAIAWLGGSTYARDWDEARLLVAWPLVLLPVALVAGRHLDLLAYGDDLARSLGLRADRTRLLAVLVAVLLAAAAVAAVGTIGFVGLVAPHAARTLVGARSRRVLTVAPLLGAALVAAADTVGRLALAPKEVPSGLVVALIGAPYFVFLLWRAGEASA